MQQCTSLSAEATYSEFKLFFHNFTLWYSIAFPSTAPCSRKQELFTRLDEQLKIEIAADFDYEKGTYLELHKALDSRINILFPQKSRLFEFSSSTEQNQGETLNEYFCRGHRQAVEVGLYSCEFGPEHFDVLVKQKGIINLEQHERLLRDSNLKKSSILKNFSSLKIRNSNYKQCNNKIWQDQQG